MALVTFTSDFGLNDSYVAEVKGVLLSQVPTLGGYLAFSLFANKIRVTGLDKEFGPSNAK